MQRGGQPAPRPADPVIVWLGVDPTRRFALLSPFFRAPAACWCARATVESTLTSQVISPSASARACSWVKIGFQVPSRCHRRNRPYTVCWRTSECIADAMPNARGSGSATAPPGSSGGALVRLAQQQTEPQVRDKWL